MSGRRPRTFLVALALAGCGEDPPPSAGEYRRAAEKACAEASGPLRALGPASTGADGERAHRAHERTVAELRRLRAPRELGDHDETLVRTAARTGDAFRDMLGKVAAPDVIERRNSVEALRSEARLFRDAADAAGVRDCGREVVTLGDRLLDGWYRTEVRTALQAFRRAKRRLPDEVPAQRRLALVAATSLEDAVIDLNVVVESAVPPSRLEQEHRALVEAIRDARVFSEVLYEPARATLARLRARFAAHRTAARAVERAGRRVLGASKP